MKSRNIIVCVKRKISHLQSDKINLIEISDPFHVTIYTVTISITI